MRKPGIIYTSIIIFIFISVSCNSANEASDLQLKKLDYPSASAIEYYEGKFYIIGDDARNMIVLDTNLAIIDTIPLLSYSAKRIPKDIKPDLEASALNADNLFLFGSGSLSPYRNIGWKHNLTTKDNDSIDLAPLYLKTKDSGIEEINIEGACFVQEKLVLVNRGSKGHPYNHFIITDERSLNNDSSFQISIISFPVQKDTASFKGISGLCYSKESNKLMLTVSTEDTRNSYDDGAIGKSYLWIINNISTKLNDKTIKPNRVIDLEYTDPRFKGQKIESATVIKETHKLIYLALVADNDDGSSTIFKMSINKSTSHGE